MSGITQTAQSQLISILPLNGLAFSPGSKVVFQIDPDLAFIKAARGESYLTINIRNNSTAQRWMFANSGHDLIQDVVVFSMTTGQQLESLQNYNQVMSFINQYASVSYGMQQSLEGMTQNPAALEFADGAVQRRRVFGTGSTDYVMNSIISPITDAGVLIPNAYQICIPLKLGIFSCFQDEKLTPVMQLGGLRIEITLAPIQPTCVPICPYIGGELYNMVGIPNYTGVKNGVPVVQGSSLDTVWLAASNVEQTGYCVGQILDFESGVSSSSGTITAIGVSGMAGVSVQITLDDDFNCGGVSGRIMTNAIDWQDNLSYTIDDIQLRVLQVVNQSAVANATKPLSYQFRTYELYLDSIPTGERRHQTEIYSVSSRAKSIMAMIYDSSLETEDNAPSYYRGTDPDTIHLNSVQFFINNRLYPLNAYNPSRTQDRPQVFNELQKAFAAMGTPAVSFGDATGPNLDGYSNTFLICRELARSSGGIDYVFDLRNAAPQIRLGFSSTRAQIARVNTFVWSDRIVEVSPTGVSVIV